MRAFTLLFLLHLSVIAEAASLFIPVQFTIENGNYDGSTVVLKKNGITQFSLPGEKNLQLKLDFNEQYLVAFSKPGYITKQIAVNTTVPEERIKTGFEPYKIGVRLYKQYAGINTVVYNQPVASIKYMAAIDEIGYDTDYTKSILSQLTDTENKLAIRAAEEKKASGSKTKNKDQEPDLSVVLQETQGGSLEASSQNLQKDQEPALDTSLPPLQPQPSPEPAGSAPATGADKAEKNATVKGEDNHSSINASSGSDERKNNTYVSGQDSKKIIIHTGQGNDPRQASPEHLRNYSKTKEEIFEPHRSITTITIKRDNKTTVYHQVKYLSGESYYFMNGSTAISPHLFEYFTGENH